MAKPYFTLVQRNPETGMWGIEFGDYDRGAVDYERQDYRDKGVRASDLRIIKTKDANNATIGAAVLRLNTVGTSANFAAIADSVAADIYQRPISEAVSQDAVIRDACDTATGGELETFPLDMLCDMVSARLRDMRPAPTAAKPARHKFPEITMVKPWHGIERPDMSPIVPPKRTKRQMTENERGQCIAALLHHANFCRDLSTLQSEGMTDRIREQFARQAVADESLADAIEQSESIEMESAK